MMINSPFSFRWGEIVKGKSLPLISSLEDFFAWCLIWHFCDFQTQKKMHRKPKEVGPVENSLLVLLFFWIFSINVSWFTHVYIEIPPSWRRSSVANWKLWKGLSIIFLLMQRLFWIQNHIKPVPGGSTDIWSQKADTLKYGLSYIFLAFTFIKQTEQNEKHVAWKLM